MVIPFSLPHGCYSCSQGKDTNGRRTMDDTRWWTPTYSNRSGDLKWPIFLNLKRFKSRDAWEKEYKCPFVTSIEFNHVTTKTCQLMNSRSRGLLTHLIQKFKRAVLIDIWQSSSLILLLYSLLTLLLNHETYFNQTKHNWKWLFSGVNHIKIVKWHLRFLKIIFSRISCQISSKFVIAQPLMSGIQMYYLNHNGLYQRRKFLFLHHCKLKFVQIII